MAWPPRASRSSTSRREQNLALIGKVITGAVVAAGLLLLLYSRAQPSQADRLRGLATDAIAPIWSAARMPFDGVRAVGDYIDDYFLAISRNRKLEADHDKAKLLTQRYAGLVRENRQLRRLLGVVDPKRRQVAVARIAGASSGSYVRTAVVSVGSRNGVAIGQPVRAVDGLIGRIVEVGQSSARVLLLSDTNSRVPVRVARTGRSAMIAGVNGPLLEVRFLAPADEPLKVGDRLLTTGDGGIFPPDIPVAVIVRAKGDVPLARPIAPPEALGFVLIEEPFLPVAPPPSPVAPQPAPPVAPPQ